MIKASLYYCKTWNYDHRVQHCDVSYSVPRDQCFINDPKAGCQHNLENSQCHPTLEYKCLLGSERTMLRIGNS